MGSFWGQGLVFASESGTNLALRWLLHVSAPLGQSSPLPVGCLEGMAGKAEARPGTTWRNWGQLLRSRLCSELRSEK